MTQIISVMTADYVLLASDRRLTLGEGPRIGEVYDDDTCKLVSLCGTTGIGYTGVGRIKGTPTHEWIAKILADAGCRDAAGACRIILDRAPAALSNVPRSVRRHTFLLAGWAHFGTPATLRSYHCLVTNTHDLSGQVAPEPLDSFHAFLRVLGEEEESYGHLLGEPLGIERAQNLRRNIRRLVERQLGPQETLRLLVDEVIHTSDISPTVGSKILGFCIPKESARARFETGQLMMLATQPNSRVATFTYFEKGLNELQQYGPTTVCGEFAVTDVKTQNDTSRDFQSSEFRILALPKSPL
jgi:hypothetical protein